MWLLGNFQLYMWALFVVQILFLLDSTYLGFLREGKVYPHRFLTVCISQTPSPVPSS